MTKSDLAAQAAATLEKRARREELRAELLTLGGADPSKWTDEQMASWNTKNREFDVVNAELKASDLRQGLIGRDRASMGYGTAGETKAVSAVDLAVAAWARNSLGIPMRPDERDAAATIGLDCTSAAMEFALPQSLRERRPMQIGAVLNALSTQDGTQGGYLVPSEFMNALWSAMKDYSGILQVAELWLTDYGRETYWPTVDDTENEATQIGQNAASDETDMVFGARKFGAYKFGTGVLRVSHELVRDSAVSIAAAIGSKFGERLGRKLNTAGTTGNGAGTIEGLITGATVGKTTTSSTTITFDELIDLQHSVDPAYRVGPSVGWMMSDTIAAHVRKLKDGEGRYLWQDSLVMGQPAMLLGYPVTINNGMTASITSGERTVAFGKLNEFKLRIVIGGGADASGARLLTLRERYAENDQVGFLGFLEADGRLMKSSSNAAQCPVRVLLQA